MSEEMVQEVTNFGRFYGVFNKMEYRGDKDEMKRDLVRQVTYGRTDSLRELTRREYNNLCALLERTIPGAAAKNALVAELKRHRSAALHQMQLLGVNTADWSRVNALCQDPRIAGKAFARLSTEELESLTTKLRMIGRKGGFRSSPESVVKAKIVAMT